MSQAEKGNRSKQTSNGKCFCALYFSTVQRATCLRMAENAVHKHKQQCSRIYMLFGMHWPITQPLS